MSLYGDLKPPSSGNNKSDSTLNQSSNTESDDKDNSNWSKLLSHKNEDETTSIQNLDPIKQNVTKPIISKSTTNSITNSNPDSNQSSTQTTNLSKAPPRATIIPPGFAPTIIKRPKPISKPRMIPGALPVVINSLPSLPKPELQLKSQSQSQSQSLAPSLPQPIPMKGVPRIREYDPNRPNLYNVIKDQMMKVKRKKWKEKQYAIRRAQRDRSSSYSRSPSHSDDSYRKSRSRSRSRSSSQERYHSYSRSRSGSRDSYSDVPYTRNERSLSPDRSTSRDYGAEIVRNSSPRSQSDRREESPEGLPFNDSSSIPSDDMTHPPYQPAPPPPPAANINLDLTGEEAYLRRAQLSGITVPATVAKNIELLDSNIIVLTNMVGPGEVDNLLEPETAQECSKFGKVLKCLVYEVPNGKLPPHESVRIYVEFEHVHAARRAISDLNGRFFGGRKVKVQFFDPERFRKFDFFPKPEELTD